MATSDAPLNVPNVTLAVARGNSATAPGIVSITGSGFGAAPNVVLYRTMREDNFDPAVVPEGEVGVMSGNSGTTLFDGRGVLTGHYSGNKATLEFVNSSPFKKFRSYNRIAVPDGFSMPADFDNGERVFPADSSWKPNWFMLTSDGNRTGIGESDLCLPTHVGNGSFKAIGNSVNHDQPFISGSKWAWNELNGFGYVFDSDDASPKTVGVTQRLQVTNSVVGTYRADKVTPGFAGTDSSVTNENAAFDRWKVSSFAESAGGAAQAYYCDHYLAVESSPGANDFKQAVCIGNAAVFENCTEIVFKKPESWTDTAIDIAIDSFEASRFTHYFVIGPDGETILKSGGLI